MNTSINFPPSYYPAYSPQGYLERAFIWLESEQEVGIFYAALELRKCYESIWLKYGLASDDYSDAFMALNWKPKVMAERLKVEFISHLDLDKSYGFVYAGTDPAVVLSYYLAVPQAMTHRKNSMNYYLHSQWWLRTVDETWYPEHSKKLLEFAHELIPYVHTSISLMQVTNKNSVPIEMEPSEIKKVLSNSLSKSPYLKMNKR